MATVTLRYWAALRAAAGESEQQVEATTLADALQIAKAAHGATPRFTSVLGICAIVVDETPVGSLDHAGVRLADGAVVDLLPPFAGG
jgi:molybdopterin converting factor small subunit